jgi:hypothetical protein
VPSRLHWPVVLALAAGACGGGPSPGAAPAQETAQPVARELGSWKGQGSTTLGFVSESGSFRINWTAQNIDNAHPGHFVLTLRSGISGRPMKVIADHSSAGGGSVEFGDDPRLYEFLVEATGINWAISVEETLSPAPGPKNR